MNAAVLPHIAPALIAWQREHGRNHLPWQRTREPYHVWLSEVMLQQTQVATVLGYYERFLAHFPTVADLAAASAEQVMALWAGLGYYSRARNLHRCAQIVVAEHEGRFPTSAAQLQTLPGIGRSTAAAIAAFCFGERVAIFDANVRRVLSRLLADAGDARALWPVAEQLLPTPADARNLAADIAAYTQGLMDLGATVCTPRRARCEVCPLRTHCRAYAENQIEKYPVKTPKPTRRNEDWYLLILLNIENNRPNKIWLERRAEKTKKSKTGNTPQNQNSIWVGLYSPPTFPDLLTAENAAQALLGKSFKIHALPSVSHALTHRQLRLFPLVCPSNANAILARGWPKILDQDNAPISRDGLWVNWKDLPNFALPSPVRKILHSLTENILNPMPLL